MKGKSVNDLKKYLSMGKSLKVCILDNNSIEFLTWVRKSVSIQRKNAGEISITVLSYIISYYYNMNVSNVTIFSSDRDTYEFVSKAKEMFYTDERFKNRSNTSITFKSNDFLIYDWRRLKYIDEHNINTFVDNYRQKRRIKFTRKKEDNSIEEQDKVVDNVEFLEILNDSTIHLIF